MISLMEKWEFIDKLRHQIYDMLFILFEIAADNKFDLDAEWDKGRQRKKEKYLSNIIRQGRL